jgi:predicted nucleic acid-binding protein
MAEGFLYLDSSALVKLVLPEPETDALLRLLADWEDRVSSALATVEVSRAARRASRDDAVHRRARRVVDGIHLVTVDDDVLRIASTLEPTTLRSLDAIHLASALVLQPDLGALVAYDERLSLAASQQGLKVLAPA